MKDYPKIIFYGTPGFAVGSLDAIVKAGFNVVAVVTAPDKPAGRGLKMMSPEVKVYAVEHGIHILQPESLKDPDFLKHLRELRPDLQVIVAFRKLPTEVWKLPPLGTFNLHASLLPKFRGAAPINHAIIQGETASGVTTFFLQEEIDTGNILYSEQVKISPDETAGELHDALRDIGSTLVVKTIDAIISGEARPVPQPPVEDPASPLYKAPKIKKEDCRIDINKGVKEVYNLIRGLSPHPGAFLETSAKDGSDIFLKIYKAIPEFGHHNFGQGQLISTDKKSLRLTLSDGFINLTKVQLAGRKAMEIEDFMRGFSKLFL